MCNGNETCASCIQDCGPCSVCPNKKCETPFENCANCPQDCGKCQINDCMGMVTCAFGCIKFNQIPPQFSLSCVADCVDRGCAKAKYFADQVVNCAIAHIGSIINCPGGNFLTCLQGVCGSEIRACLNTTCN